MNRTEIRELASKARTDLKVARGAFRKLALENGFKGSHGGWISKGDGPAVVQGWQGLADLVHYGSVTFTVTEERDAQDRRAAEAEAELEEADAVDLDAIHAEAIDEDRTRDLDAQIVAEREHLRLHTAYSFSYINEHAQRNVMGRIYTKALAEYRAARIAAKRALHA